MLLLHLTTLCLFIAGNHMEVVGSAMCDDGWAYHLDTATCLQAIGKFNEHLSSRVIEFHNPCRSERGGQYRNISGDIVSFTEGIEPFIRDYLQFAEVQATIVELSDWLSGLISDRFFWHPKIDRNLLTYFLPGKTVPFTVKVQPRATVLCQVPAGPVEPPACPREVKLVSVSENSAVLSWSPGQLGRKVDINVVVYDCQSEPLSCKNVSTFFKDVSAFQRMNYTVSGLLPNTQYKLIVQKSNENDSFEDCNVTLDLSTNEEVPVTMPRTEEALTFSASVVGLAVAFVISVCVISVLAIALWRYYRQAKKGSPNNLETTGAKVLKPTARSQEAELKENKSRPNSSNVYINNKQQSGRYDKTIVYQQDEHIYEM